MPKRVSVSSTFADLKEYRAAVRKVIKRQDDLERIVEHVLVA